MPIYLDLFSYLFFVFLTSYLVGSFNAAYLVARLNNIDIRNQGSGNPGTANVLRVFGKKVAILVLLVDVLKGFIAPYWWTFYLTAYDSNCCYFETSLLAWYIGIYMSGFAVIVGHCYPLYYKFKGGKGVASYVGFLLFLFSIPSFFENSYSFKYWHKVELSWLLLLLVMYFIVLKLTKTSALASLSVVFSSIFIFYDSSVLHSSYIGYSILQQNGGSILFLFTVLLIFWRHKSNFDRLIKGDDNKF